MDTANPVAASAAFLVLALSFAAAAGSSRAAESDPEAAVRVGAAVFLIQLGLFVALAAIGAPGIAVRALPLSIGAVAVIVLSRSTRTARPQNARSRRAGRHWRSSWSSG